MKSKQRKNLNKFISTLATTTMVSTAIAPVATLAVENSYVSKNLTFTDVNSRYKEAVEFVLSKGVQGYSSTKFGSYDQIKRLDAAIILAKVLELDADNAPATSFTDVPARGQKYVNALYEAGITSGKNKTQFGSNDLITRGEMAVWIARAFDLQGSGKVSFTDVSKNYVSAVSALVENNISNGFSETTFGTTTALIRGDFAVLMHRAATLNGNTEENVGDFSIDLEFGNDYETLNSKAVANNGMCSTWSGILLVGFNKAVNQKESLDPNNFIVNGVPVESVEMLEDEENVVVLYLKEDAIETSQEYEVKVQNIVSKNGEKMETYTTQEYVYENTRPVVEAASVVDDKTIRITFSEMVEKNHYMEEAITVGEGSYSIAEVKGIYGFEKDQEFDITLEQTINKSKPIAVEILEGSFYDSRNNEVRSTKIFAN